MERFERFVLAREERLLAESPFSPFSTLAWLRRFDSAATLFAMQCGGAWFLGASPERLVRLHDNRVDVTCLAGSIGMGRDEDERRQLQSQLLASTKDREEHEIVVRSTMSALGEVCEDVTRLAGNAPGRHRAYRATSGDAGFSPLSEAGGVLDLVERLHPTPAVGGYPTDRALAIMRELEEIDRGWYAGAVWLDRPRWVWRVRGGDPLALLSGRIASLFAGSGIVDDSVPLR